MKTKPTARQPVPADDKLLMELEWLIQNPTSTAIDIRQLTVASAKRLQRELNDIFGQVTINGGVL